MALSNIPPMSVMPLVTLDLTLTVVEVLSEVAVVSGGNVGISGGGKKLKNSTSPHPEVSSSLQRVSCFTRGEMP